MGRIPPYRSRFSRYIRGLFRVAVLLAAVGLLLGIAQQQYHFFDREIAFVAGFVAQADAKLSNEAFAGISIGSLVLVLGLCIFPIFLKKIDSKGYRRGLWRGVVSALVFFVSIRLYAFAENASRLYALAVMVLVIVVSALLVEGVALAVGGEEERSFRTDVVASIASGLLFGVLLKLGEYGYEWLKGMLTRI